MSRQNLLNELRPIVEALGEIGANQADWLSHAEAKILHTATEMLQWLEEELDDGTNEDAEPGNEGRKLTIEHFRASRRRCEDLGEQLADARWDEGKGTGYIYLNELYIEDVTATWPAKAQAEGKYHLIIGNIEKISDDLAELEKDLFEYARLEGYTSDDAMNALIAEYDEWNKSNGLQLGSADEHLFDENLTEAQREYLRQFVARWTLAAA